MKNTLSGQVKAAINEAFEGVVLNAGVSMKQARVIDNYGNGLSQTKFHELKQSEVCNDWRKIPLEELLTFDCVAHFDAEGFKYYIPALMISVIDHYDSSMRVIGTLSSLDYEIGKPQGYYDYRYSLLTESQKISIAFFLNNLPMLVQLSAYDRKLVERSLSNYWGKYGLLKLRST